MLERKEQDNKKEFRQMVTQCKSKILEAESQSCERKWQEVVDIGGRKSRESQRFITN